MKKTLILIAGLSASLLCACTKENTNTNNINAGCSLTVKLETEELAKSAQTAAEKTISNLSFVLFNASGQKVDSHSSSVTDASGLEYTFFGLEAGTYTVGCQSGQPASDSSIPNTYNQWLSQAANAEWNMYRSSQPGFTMVGTASKTVSLGSNEVTVSMKHTCAKIVVDKVEWEKSRGDETTFSLWNNNIITSLTLQSIVLTDSYTHALFSGAAAPSSTASFGRINYWTGSSLYIASDSKGAATARTSKNKSLRYADDTSVSESLYCNPCTDSDGTGYNPALILVVSAVYKAFSSSDYDRTDYGTVTWYYRIPLKGTGKLFSPVAGHEYVIDRITLTGPGTTDPTQLAPTGSSVSIGTITVKSWNMTQSFNFSLGM